ncbi:DegT/DnrJ/EryC1/StrS family aminotransferase [Gramella lutea]|uniref:DegT/DnrJ/EryC1/StrS family aminotransferase n=1 Tax=Christiangramia lutea TaxID=1607951 RepID=A0A9X2A7V7_9FLAO|nr:DegT/DnrJ/EryC1/StrS family aminotransferase [Christiangramia lutea]MCH4821859.1 DegT/DnrJ/EryC1/StrS family aminotransferase [Christiangramia lutea]
MKKIQMVDLKGQYEGIKNEVNQGMQEILEETSFINGPHVYAFQKELEEYLGVRNVIPCANGTDALQIAMMGLRLKPGDEVITADFTFAATVEVIALLQLTPVLVDVDPETFNIDPEEIKKAITPNTKAIVPVHLFGQTSNMDEIMEIAREHDLFVIEDNAQAIGANYHSKDGKTQKAGTIGDVAATSFFPSKNLGCYGDGGAIFTNNDELAHTIRGIVNHGMYERYHHDVVGVNSRLDSFQAAVLRAKLKRLDIYNEARKKAAISYSEAFKENEHIVTPVRSGDCDTHVYHQYTLKIKNGKRDALAKHLQEKGIPFGIYYPIPLHRQKAYLDERYQEKNFSVTNKLVEEVISLPMHTELEEEQIKYIAKTINDFVNA